MAWASAYSFGKITAKRGYNSAKRFSRRSKSFSEYGVWIFSAFALYLVYRIFKPFLLANDGLCKYLGMCKDEQTHELDDAISNLPVNQSNLTITDSEATQIAQSIHNAVAGFGTDELSLVKTCHKNWPLFLQFYAEDYGTEDGFDLLNMKTLYNQMYSIQKYNIDELHLIAKKYGTRKSDLTGPYFSLSQAIHSDLAEDAPDLYDFIKHIFNGTQIQFP